MPKFVELGDGTVEISAQVLLMSWLPLDQPGEKNQEHGKKGKERQGEMERERAEAAWNWETKTVRKLMPDPGQAVERVAYRV